MNPSEATLVEDDGRLELSVVLISLLKGVVEQSSDGKTWETLLRLQSQVRDYVSALGLELTLDEAEGYAFLRSSSENEENSLPRLVARRPLSFQVSLLLALLRKKMVESDATGGETRLVLSMSEIVELLRVFLPETTNEARLMDQIETQINKVVDLGFLRKLKAADGALPTFEVRRIIKAFVDAQWLADFDQRLEEYRQLCNGNATGQGATDE